MSKLILIRGLPGSGKSTMAREIVGNMQNAVHYEADMYFEVNGEYRFDPKKLPQAHRWCQDMSRSALENGQTAVVSNTFTRLWEMKSYLDMAKELGVPVEILVAIGNYKNLHGVPDDAIEKMRQRWEN